MSPFKSLTKKPYFLMFSFGQKKLSCLEVGYVTWEPLIIKQKSVVRDV